MTAEVAVMNRSAVALAADSAVTLGNPVPGTSKSLKIYYTANKLFALSKYQPVGVMVYGNADLLAYPWETLIKEYRRSLGTVALASIKDYGDHFIRFFNKNEHFDRRIQDSYLEQSVYGFLGKIKAEIDSSVKSHIEKKGSINEAEVIAYIKERIRDNLQTWQNTDFLPGKSLRDVARFSRARKIKLDELRKQVFEKLPLDADDIRSLNELSGMLFFKDWFKRSTSGVVIAGFGTKELFPSLVVYSIEGIIQDRPKYKLLSLDKIDYDNGAIIYPFAQKEMVHTFIEGIDPEISEYIKSYMNELLDKYPEKIINAVPCATEDERKQVLENMKEAGSAMLKEFDESFKKMIRKTHVSPIIDIVGSLPKNELAEMAEALVNLTSIKRRMSSEAETVGGPVDVAVISKGDGFIWIKRKHYFKPELNQQFFSNYFGSSSASIRRTKA